MTFKEEIREILDILFDKLDELKLKYVIHTKEDEGYEKLCYDDSFIIDIINPLRSDYECYIEVDDFLSFNYGGNEDLYDRYFDQETLEQINASLDGIVSNKIAALTVNSGGKCYYFCYVNADEVEQVTPEYAEKLIEEESMVELWSNGWEIQIKFWNPALDRKITVPKRNTYFYIMFDNGCLDRHLLTVSDSEDNNATFVREDYYVEWKKKKYFTISKKAVTEIVNLIKDNPVLFSIDSKSVDSLNRKLYKSADRNFIKKVFYFSDGDKSNTIKALEMFCLKVKKSNPKQYRVTLLPNSPLSLAQPHAGTDAQDEPDTHVSGQLKEAFEVACKIIEILLNQGIPKEYFSVNPPVIV